MVLCANPYLGEARERFEQLQYDQALNPLILATQVPGQTQAERREAFDLLARTRAALGDLPAATRTYGELLEKDPSAPAPSDAAPKIREAFRAAKAALFPPGTVRLTRVNAAEGRLGFELFDPWSVVARLDVHEVGGRTLSARPEAVVNVRVPFTQAWVEALDASGATVGSLGSAKEPLRLAQKTVVAAKPKTDDAPVISSAQKVSVADDEAPVAPSVAAVPPSAVAISPVKAWRMPVVITGASLAAISGAIGLGFGIAARLDAAKLTGLPMMGLITELSQREAFELAGRQRSEAMGANIALGLAAGLAVTTFFIFVLSAERAP